MNCLSLSSTDPFFNLAVDEYLLKSSNEEYLILGINSPAVIIGKHQIPHRETDARYIAMNNIPVIRRISGGGTVFHDQGNLNFSFISNSAPGKQVDFRKYMQPVIKFLATAGAGVTFEGKNDLKINGLKISGNAEHVWRNRVLHHGTLLFDSKLDIMKKSLKKDNSCYLSRAVASNPSQVTNLKDHLISINNINELKQKMLLFFIGQDDKNSDISLSGKEITEINNLADSKYRTWEWNYAYGPSYQFMNKLKINGRSVNIHLTVSDGVIQECIIEGSELMNGVARKLAGCRHMPRDLSSVLRKEKVFLNDDELFTFF
ncbi:MAG: lipoate--protein ligase [Bacteroidales bacterium]